MRVARLVRRALPWLAATLVVLLGCTSGGGARAQEETGETKFEFQAEVSRLMDIIINSLYANRDVFMRELLSNASDALDRIRYLSVKDDKELGEGENRELEVRISFDKDARALTIRDRGVGMTREDLIQNLGTVARSGTTAFIEQMAGGQGDLSMIGQFGVGFYSVYLAADKVVVRSKHNDDPDQWIWTSSADSTFTIKKDPEGATLGRGTAVTLYLKEDANDYADMDKLEAIIRKYSEFIAYPIHVRKPKEVPDPAAEEAAEEAEPATGDAAVDEDEDGLSPRKKAKAPPKTITTFVWERVNEQPAIWTRNKDDVADEEYGAFYKALTKDWSDPLTWTHFRAEGEIEFKSLLYVPKFAPPGMYDNYYGKSASLKLYVRRVLITDEFEDLVPRYLSFIKGVVDSDDLPLNVSREQLQQHKILKVIGKKLARKVLEMLKQLSDEDDEARRKVREDGEEPAADETKFAQLWKAFSKSLKLGVLEDAVNRARLVKMLRFQSTTQNVTTLEEYVSRMPSWQAGVFFLAGESPEELRLSPFLERARAKGVEVLLMPDALDEYVVQNVPDFEGKKLTNLAKEGVKFGDESADDAAREAHHKEALQPLCAWLKATYGDVVEKVVVSSRVVDSPSVIVTSQFGHTANMQRIMKAQTMSDPDRQKYMLAKRTMEVNPRHPVIAELAKRVAADPDSAEAKDFAWLVLDVALLNSGFDIEQPALFSGRMLRLLQKGLALDSLALLPEVDPPKRAGKPAADVAAEDIDSGFDLDSHADLEKKEEL